MAKGDFYFPLHYIRLLASTQGWKDDEFGCYVRLLIHQFDNGSIPEDLDELKRIAPSVGRHWERLIKKKFKDAGNGRLINDFMNDIYTDAQAKKEKNRENGKRGGRPRKKNPNETEPKPNGFENETQTKGILIYNSKESIVNSKEGDSLSPAFQFESSVENGVVKFKIEDCFTIAQRDKRWVEASGATPKLLGEFHKHLEAQAEFYKNPDDYKKHFTNWKKKSGAAPAEDLKASAAMKAQQLREQQSRKILGLEP